MKSNAGSGAGFSLVATETVSGNNRSKYVDMTEIWNLVTPNHGRVMANEEYYLEMKFVNNGGGTNFQVHNPIITYLQLQLLDFKL